MITRMLCWSDGDGKVIEGGTEPVAGGAGGDVVVAAGAGSARRRDRRRGSELSGDASARASAGAGFQPSVVCLDRVVRILPGGVQGRGISSSGTRGQTSARPVLTPTRIVPARSAPVKTVRA